MKKVTLIIEVDADKAYVVNGVAEKAGGILLSWSFHHFQQCPHCSHAWMPRKEEEHICPKCREYIVSASQLRPRLEEDDDDTSSRIL